MRVRVLYHDHCFDGAASAAYFSRFLADAYYPDAQFLFTGLAHKATQLFHEDMFDGDENAIVDFKYCANPRLTWWFDHHQSAFLSPSDEQHFLADKSGKKFYDPSYRSCTMLIATVTRERFGYRADDLEELVKWADIIDGALYPNPEMAVELKEPALKLMLVIENAPSQLVQQIVRWLRTRSLEEIVAEEQIQELYTPLYQKHLNSIEIIQRVARYEGDVVFFDLVDYGLEAYNKFIPYYLYPDCLYTVSVTTSSFRTKVSVGSNPWAPRPLRHNLATICERYGGGGHARVGAISFEPGDIELARQVAREIVEILNKEPDESIRLKENTPQAPGVSHLPD